MPTPYLDALRDALAEPDPPIAPDSVAGPVPPHVVRRLFERIIDETRTLEREASGRG